MPDTIKLKRGISIPIQGEPPRIVVQTPLPKIISIQPTDFRGLAPKLFVKEGDRVTAGDPLFADKNRPRILFTAPVGGVVGAMSRGDKRKLLSINIHCDYEVEKRNFPVAPPNSLSRNQIVEILLLSGCWPYLVQRPYGVVAHPDDHPRAIFISAFDSAPLAPDIDFILSGQEADLQYGIDVLQKLTPKEGIFIGIRNPKQKGHVRQTKFSSLKNVHLYLFEGKHPVGNVGVQIHHIAPISKGEVVWTIDPQSVVIIGRLFKTGVINTTKMVALTGPSATKPCYLSLLPGTPLCTIEHIGIHNPAVRYISGNCLTGTNVGYNGSLGFYHHQITLLPEGNHQELLGWVKMYRPKTFSISRSYLSWLSPKKMRRLHTNMNGGVRAFVMSDVYDKVLPMKLYPVYLLKAILAGDIDKMEAFGIYEVIEEDLALCEFVCPSKINIQEIISNGIDLMIKEMS